MHSCSVVTERRHPGEGRGPVNVTARCHSLSQLNVAASKNPRARSTAVSPAVIALVIVKRGENAVISKLTAKGAVLERGEERVQLRQRRALRRLQRLHRRHSTGEFALQ